MICGLDDLWGCWIKGFERCLLSPMRRFKVPFLAFEVASDLSQFSNGPQQGFGPRSLPVEQISPAHCWGLAQGRNHSPEVVWMQLLVLEKFDAMEAARWSWCVSAPGWDPTVTTSILKLGTIIIHLWILIANLQHYNKGEEKKSLANVDIEHVNCDGNSKFDFWFF